MMGQNSPKRLSFLVAMMEKEGEEGDDEKEEEEEGKRRAVERKGDV